MEVKMLMLTNYMFHSSTCKCIAFQNVWNFRRLKKKNCFSVCHGIKRPYKVGLLKLCSVPV